MKELPLNIIVTEREYDTDKWTTHSTCEAENVSVAKAFLKDAIRQQPQYKFRMFYFRRGSEIKID